MSENIGTLIPQGSTRAVVREFRPRTPVTMRQVARALGAKQHLWDDRIRFTGRPEHKKQVETIGMPLTDTTFVIYLRFPALIQKASNFADIVGDRY